MKLLQNTLKLTNEEKQKLENCFYLPGWQFETIIEAHCIKVEEYWICFEDGNSVYAIVYGLRAVMKESQKPCIANFFIHYGSKVYQTRWLQSAVKIVELIRKELKCEEQEEKLRRIRMKEKNKAEKAAKKLKQAA